jgi:hypothetical protein
MKYKKIENGIKEDIPAGNAFGQVYGVIKGTQIIVSEQNRKKFFTHSSG